MISKKEVKDIAKLARLGLDQKELTKMGKELSLILDYIQKLKEVDLKKEKSKNYLIEARNIMRKDEFKVLRNDISKKLIKMTPDNKDNYLKVRTVLK